MDGGGEPFGAPRRPRNIQKTGVRYMFVLVIGILAIVAAFVALGFGV